MKAGFVSAGSGRRRDRSIDSLRGLAIVLVVAGHVIGGDASQGMEVGESSGWRHAYEVLADGAVPYSMPIFAAVAGFVFALTESRRDMSASQFMLRKAQRLLVPMVVVGTAYIAVQLATGTLSGSPARAWLELLATGYAHFWFLQALFVIFALVKLLTSLGLVGSFRS